MSENKEAIKAKIIKILTSTEVYVRVPIIEFATRISEKYLTIIMEDNIAEQYAAALVQSGLSMEFDDDEQTPISIKEYCHKKYKRWL